MKTVHWTSKDLEILPEDDGTRYEIIDGELYVSKQPHKHHQLVCTRIWTILQTWSIQTDNSTLYQNDTIRSPHLPGFTCQVSELFYDIARRLPGTSQNQGS